MALSTFDLISDLHADFWLDRYPTVDHFVDELLPEEPSKVLVIAGDLGHLNSQNERLIKSFKRIYDQILVTFGNHDLYLDDYSERCYFDNNSGNRINAMKTLFRGIEGVTVLDGSCVLIDGVTFGGTGMWHDFSYGATLGFSESYLYDVWQVCMNDSNLIFPTKSRQDLKGFFEEELTKLEAIFEQSQVIVTHVGPDAASMPQMYKSSPVSTFFYFDGSNLLSRAHNKIWCYGHTHSHADYHHSNGCRLINNAFGYPRERLQAKIRTIHL
ncbi:hypothetical protein J41TS12_37050 [Paenibacillus antibioticophila]|uniref:Calcineurin-like phosphoesterase domain-containing protein n=1 Tax=Paenibacillus antibioticophila TaxID=1274374 RepID=A0A920CIZ7_9BACL|nr:metallophosphoesterase [Paenibacillus antibioticophila]GIO38844.1 hypothetical protein J41TS12_37050 [Paenibacillus antibioticophila]